GAYAEDVPVIITETENPLQAIGATAGLRYELSRWTSVSLLYEARRVNSDSTQFVEAVGTPLTKYTKNSIRTTLQRDTRLDLFDPHAGSVTTASAEFVGGVFRGNSQFLKLTGTATTYRPWQRRLTIALRARGGIITSGSQGPADTLDITDLDLIPTDDRFRTGGATTVRGYQENEIGTIVADSAGTLVDRPRGGAYLLLVNAEIRARLNRFLGAAAFLDGGGVWEQASDLSWRRILSISNGAGYKDMRWVAGLGVRIATPVGPVRLDYGWKLRLARWDEPDAVTGRGGFAFSLGQAY
ncbi:MAG TPA: BamA/TamA family outer membrane protein, partial [Candidatus Eisenbacteria bacterium]|nr:BamA/TamA family outer membrane protein [Candidatus Eisenbacteria bacterium]